MVDDGNDDDDDDDDDDDGDDDVGATCAEYSFLFEVSIHYG